MSAYHSRAKILSQWTILFSVTFPTPNSTRERKHVGDGSRRDPVGGKRRLQRHTGLSDTLDMDVSLSFRRFLALTQQEHYRGRQRTRDSRAAEHANIFLLYLRGRIWTLGDRQVGWLAFWYFITRAYGTDYILFSIWHQRSGGRAGRPPGHMGYYFFHLFLSDLSLVSRGTRTRVWERRMPACNDTHTQHRPGI